MLHRTSSSRRRRASRSAATSPQARSPRSSAHPSRRASLATTETDDEIEPPPPQRSPRASLAPESALDTYHRSPRHSLVPEIRSARNSITPDTAPQIRNTLAPSRNNLCVDLAYGSRLSLNPQDFNRSPRNSITPDMSARSPRRSLIPEGTSWNQPRNSLVPDVGRSPRHSVASIQIDPARSQKELGPSPRTSPRGCAPDAPVKSKDIPEINRSPRGSLVPDSQRSPRGSIAPSERSARGSLVAADGDASKISPRGSLTLTFQEPLISRERRASEDSQAASNRGRSVSPYRASLGGRQSGTGVLSDAGSRRASSSVSQEVRLKDSTRFEMSLLMFPTAGAKAFTMDGIGRLGHDPPRGQCGLAGANDCKCSRDPNSLTRNSSSKIFGHPSNDDHCESCLTCQRMQTSTTNLLAISQLLCAMSSPLYLD
ncbi:hypothetical protein evm_014280 [Chilo suppressalis]|nr:hypothetical protein evm_014280 [Chilo suppressalis]